MAESFLDGKVTLHRGDCLDVLPLLEANSVDSVCTDPPYHLTSIVKRFGSETAAPCQVGKTGAYARASKGFMGKQWDGGGIAFDPETWALVLRVLKPGGHLLAFGGTRTYHSMASAIEMAGFEIRDQIAWTYGSGFPKSHNLGNGLGTALKPAWEPIVLARKPLSEPSIAANVLKHGTGGINIDGCRIGVGENVPGGGRSARGNGGVYGDGIAPECAQSHANGRWPANLIHDGSEEVLAGFPESGPPCGSPKKSASQGTIAGSPNAQAGSNAAYVGDSGSAARFFASFPFSEYDLSWNQSAKDAEKCFLQCHQQSESSVPDIVPRKWFLSLVQNVKSAENLCGSCAIAIALSIAAMRQGQSPEEVLSRVSISERNKQILCRYLVQYAEGRAHTDTITTIENLKILLGSVRHAIDDCTNSARGENAFAHSRLHYTSKADTDDRLGSKHPTVKPLDLMQYLCRLITPPNGVVLDPFAGTGTTGEAAFREGFNSILVEREVEYQADIVKRMGLCLSGPDARNAASVKQLEPDDLPLFGGAA